MYTNFDKEVSRYNMYLGNLSYSCNTMLKKYISIVYILRYIGKPGIPWNMIFIAGKKFVCWIGSTIYVVDKES